MSIARHDPGSATLKPSAVRKTVVHPDGNGVDVCVGEGGGEGVGVDVAAVDADGAEQAIALRQTATKIQARTARC